MSRRKLAGRYCVQLPLQGQHRLLVYSGPNAFRYRNTQRQASSQESSFILASYCSFSTVTVLLAGAKQVVLKEIRGFCTVLCSTVSKQHEQSEQSCVSLLVADY